MHIIKLRVVLFAKQVTASWLAISGWVLIVVQELEGLDFDQTHTQGL